jgi:hypothetical protein
MVVAMKNPRFVKTWPDEKPIKVEIRGDGQRQTTALEFDSENCLADLLLDCWDAMSPNGRTSVLGQMGKEAGES